MSKKDYLAGKYPVGSSMHKIYKHKYGAIPVVSAPEAETKVVEEISKPVSRKKVTKRTTKTTSKD